MEESQFPEALPQNSVNPTLTNGTKEWGKPRSSTNVIKKPHKCTRCLYRCQYPSDLKKHMAIHERRDDPSKWLRCDQCDFKTPYPSGVTAHKKTHSAVKEFKCKLCDYAAFFRNSLNRHVIMVHTLESAEYRQRQPALQEKTLKCPECDFITAHPTSLKYHILRHRDEKPLKCKLCAYSCVKGEQLRIHLATKHKVKEAYYKACAQCGYSAISRAKYVIHMEAKHGESVVQLKHQTSTCSKCHSVFHNNLKLLEHKKACLGKKLHQCSKCDYQINSQSLMATHVKYYHASEKKEFQCPNCSYQSNNRLEFDRHGLIHWPVLYTSNERPHYKCDQCEYTSTDRHKLGRHLVIHKPGRRTAEQKIHLCQFCGFNTHAYQSLTFHIRKFHNVATLVSTASSEKSKGEPEAGNVSSKTTKMASKQRASVVKRKAPRKKLTGLRPTRARPTPPEPVTDEMNQPLHKTEQYVDLKGMYCKQ